MSVCACGVLIPRANHFLSVFQQHGFAPPSGPFNTCKRPPNFVWPFRATDLGAGQSEQCVPRDKCNKTRPQISQNQIRTRSTQENPPISPFTNCISGQNPKNQYFIGDAKIARAHFLLKLDLKYLDEECNFQNCMFKIS